MFRKAAAATAMLVLNIVACAHAQTSKTPTEWISPVGNGVHTLLYLTWSTEEGSNIQGHITFAQWVGSGSNMHVATSRTDFKGRLLRVHNGLTGFDETKVIMNFADDETWIGTIDFNQMQLCEFVDGGACSILAWNPMYAGTYKEFQAIIQRAIARYRQSLQNP